MTSIIKFTPLAGALNEGPSCYLLQVDDFKFLLDCGWDERFNGEVLENIRKHLPSVNAILLSHGDLQHIGALPALLKDIPWNCSIYATNPVYQLGQLALYDQHESYAKMEEFTKYTLDDVDELFERITTVKFNQMVKMEESGLGLSITPLHAGRLVGGAAWKIMTNNEEGEIIYAVDFNHKRDRHLNKCSFVDSEYLSGRPPQLLITDAYNASYTHKRRKDRDNQLLSTIQKALHNDGNVLIVADSAGRVLELAVLLDLFWSNVPSNLSGFSLNMISHVAYNVIQFSRQMLEWMCDDITNRMTTDFQNSPFNFKHLNFSCRTLKHLAQTPQPRCVLASMADMESGLSRQLFAQYASDPRNAVIITNRTSVGTLARTLVDNPTLSHIKLEMARHEPIDGEELAQYKKEIKLKQEQIKKIESSDEDSDEEEQNNDYHHTSSMQVDQPAPKKSGGFFKQAKKNVMMYQYTESRVKWDDYGEVINPEDFRLNEIVVPADEGQGKKKQDKKSNDINRDEQHTAATNDNNAHTNEEEDQPYHVVHDILDIDIKCKLEYIDFEGRSDGDSLLKIVQQINPREVILVRGSPESTAKFAKGIAAQNKKLNKPPIEVYTPAVNETVDTTKETNLYQVRMTDSLMNSFQFVPVKDAELCWINAKVDYTEGVRDNAKVLSEKEIEDVIVDTNHDSMTSSRRLTMSDDVEMTSYDDTVQPPGTTPPPSPPTQTTPQRKSSRTVDEPLDEDFDYMKATPSLQLLSVEEMPAHKTTYINELRLSDFKQILQKEGIQAEFIGGVLVCNNIVAIRRTRHGAIDMEGAISRDYYKIRDLLYKQYAII